MVLVTRTHRLSKLAFRGGVRVIILPCPNWSILLNLGVFLVIIESLVPLGPLGLMGPHVPVTRVWGTLIEANCHWLHLHASV